jgi:hypothetical protein
MFDPLQVKYPDGKTDSLDVNEEGHIGKALRSMYSIRY